MPSSPRPGRERSGRPVSWPATTGLARDTWPKAGRLTAAPYQAEEIICLYVPILQVSRPPSGQCFKRHTHSTPYVGPQTFFDLSLLEEVICP